MIVRSEGPTLPGLEERIRALGPWFHNLKLHGVSTAPEHFLGDYPENYFQTFAHALPRDLTGRSVLDIGCNAGFFSIEMKRRGARRVLGIDHDERYLEQARLATELAGVEVELRKLDVYDVGALGERFDVVLFMGVLYHLRHPLLALDLLYEHVVGDLLVFQCMQRGSQDVFLPENDASFEERAMFERSDYPHLSFIESRYAHDPTNWWAPNRACAEAMLRSAGFALVDAPTSELYLCRRTEGPRAHPGAAYPAAAARGHGGARS